MTGNLHAFGQHGIVPARSAEFPHGPRWTAYKSIRLSLRPGPRMTWFDVGTLLFLMGNFVNKFSEFEFHVEMNSIQAGLLGSANLRYYDGPVLVDES